MITESQTQNAAMAARVMPALAPHITVELTNICNLHCSYCIRDDDALHGTRAKFFPLDLLARVIEGARAAYDMHYVTFTGGETTLHPQFAEIVELVARENMQLGFVTNGWHFDRVYPALIRHKAAVRMVAFSLDGATRGAHDHWRGEGSFDRVIRAVTRCHMQGIPFIFKTVIRRDTLPQLEQIAMMGARLGASAVHFAHLLPTSSEQDSEFSLSLSEQRSADYEIATLANIFKMAVAVGAGYYNIDPASPCSVLSGTSCNVDWRGRLTLCCNLAGYRGASAEEPDVIADLTQEDFQIAYRRLRDLAEAQLVRRRNALAAFSEAGAEPDLATGSPCAFCLHSLGKIPWHANSSKQDAGRDARRLLPVLT